MPRVPASKRKSSGAIQTLKAAEAIAGSLGKPSKMPGYAYGIPARRCQVGSVLAKLPNTVCSKCYALRGQYQFAGAQAGLERRWRSLTDPRWVEAMTFMIRYRKDPHFRWHDSGDLQSLEHLEKIVEIAKRIPETVFYLPTREKNYVHQFLTLHGNFPSNLVVRVSATLIDGPPPVGFANTATVVTSGATCPAPQQNNNCGKCRMCWDPKIPNISYQRH